MADNRQQINWRSRIVKRGTILASQITPHPNNPRRHPQAQRDAVAASFNELGQIAPIVINVNNGYLVDGEERSWLAIAQDTDVEVEAVWVDLSEEEHEKALLVFDWITQMAVYDREALDSLLRDVNTDDATLQALLSDLAEQHLNYTLPDAQPQQEPTLRGECLVEIYCSQSDLDDFRRTLDDWSKRAGVTVNIS